MSFFAKSLQFIAFSQECSIAMFIREKPDAEGTKEQS
jgi:hypothetical protein